MTYEPPAGTGTIQAPPPAPPTTAVGEAPEGGGRPFNHRLIAILVAVALIAAGGAFAAVRLLGDDPAEDRAIRLVPRGAAIYGHVFLNPSRNQKAAIRDLLENFPDAGTPEEARAELIELFDRFLNPEGFAFERDIESWLGDQIAFYMDLDRALLRGENVGAFGAVAASDDDIAARDFLDKLRDKLEDEGRSIEDHSVQGVDFFQDEDDTVYALVESFVFVGSGQGLKSALEALETGDTLADSERFRRTMAGFSDDRLALLYLDFKSFVDAAIAEGSAPPNINVRPLRNLLARPNALSVFARSDGIVFDQVGPILGPIFDVTKTFAQSEGILPELPGRSWLAIGIPKSGEVARDFLDLLVDLGVPGREINRFFETELGLDLNRDFLSWMGDLGVFVQGTGIRTISGGLVVETSDPARSAATIRAIGRRLKARGLAPVKQITNDSFVIQAPGMPEPLTVIAARERVVAVYGREATEQALGSGGRLGESAGFRDAREALGSEFTVNGYVAVQPILELIDLYGGIQDPVYLETIRPNLEPLRHIVFGSRIRDGVAYQRTVIGIGE